MSQVLALCFPVAPHISQEYRGWEWKGDGWMKSTAPIPRELDGGVICEDSDSIYHFHAQKEGEEYIAKLYFQFLWDKKCFI